MKKHAIATRFASLRRRFRPSTISQALRAIFPGRAESPRSPRPRQGQSFNLEALEPRLLLSAATIDYVAAVTSTSFTLAATDATHVQLTGDGGYSSGAIDLAGHGGALDLTRSTGAALFGDTIHLDLASLHTLTTGLSVNFTGGLQSLLSQDLVQLDGAGTFAYDVSIKSDSAIKVAAGASLDATGHDITLQASETSPGLGISGHNFLADARHATVSVLGDLTGANVSLKADSTIDARW